MLKGFKDFLLRGNIVDLAIAVVMGTALVALVTSFTENFINPLIARAGGGGSVGGKIDIGKGQALDYGAFIGAVIMFLIVAAVVYFFIALPMKKALEKYTASEEPGPDEVALLTEIRDLLSEARENPTTGGNHSA